MTTKRRDFLRFLGASSFIGIKSKDLFASEPAASKPKLRSLTTSKEDILSVADGFNYSIVVKAGERLTTKGDAFGTGCDFIGVMKGQKPSELFLWVNHESPDWLFLHGELDIKKKTKSHIIEERKACGGSFLKIMTDSNNHWKAVPGDSANFRITSETKIPFASKKRILDSNLSTGMVANCSGGQTPWGTILTCEENYEEAYGEVGFLPGGKRFVDDAIAPWGWNKFFPEAPEHYGWVVEVDPKTKTSKKLTALGRFAHEGALVVPAADGRCVVYMGDDAADRCIYKFVSDRPGTLESGTLYVADAEAGVWRDLSIKANPVFKKTYGSEEQCLVRTREAAYVVGGTRFARPEGMSRDPLTGAIFIALTGDEKKKNYYGSILKLEEEGGNPLAMNFKTSNYLAGGESQDFSCPDNLAFDKNGNLWFTVDISGKKQHRGPYEAFGNNSLYVVPRTGVDAGRVLRIANAPVGAEFTGPAFSPDEKTLFVCVQHPGEASPSREALSGRWPDQGIPRSAVISISGPQLQAFTS